MAPFKRYVVTLAAAVTVLMGGVAAFCALVDPYGIVGAPPIPGLTARKVAAAAHQRLAKPSMVELRDPTTLILGSSVANLGIDPDGAEWTPVHRPVFNLGIDGAGPPTQLHLLRHALARTHPKRVVLVLSFEDALMPAPQFVAAHAEMFEFEARMRVMADGRPNPGFWLAHASDLTTALLSGTALSASLGTLRHQNDTWSSHLTPGGLDSGGRMDREVAAHGQAALIDSWLAELSQRLVRSQATPGSPVQAWPLGSVQAMVALARQAGAETVIVIAPVRAEQLELRRQFGIEPAVRRWRHGLAALAAAAQVPLWDFGGVTAYGTEPPAAPLAWFYDTSHFRPALGAVMVARIEGGAGPFGTLLTPDTADAQSTRIESDVTAWEQANPAAPPRVAAAIAEGRHRLCLREPALCNTVTVAR